jgi:hypothetical protein
VLLWQWLRDVVLDHGNHQIVWHEATSFHEHLGPFTYGETAQQEYNRSNTKNKIK